MQEIRLSNKTNKLEQEFLGRPFTAAINEDFFGEHWIASKNMWE